MAQIYCQIIATFTFDACSLRVQTNEYSLWSSSSLPHLCCVQSMHTHLHPSWVCRHSMSASESNSSTEWWVPPLEISTMCINIRMDMSKAFSGKCQSSILINHWRSHSISNIIDSCLISNMLGIEWQYKWLISTFTNNFQGFNFDKLFIFIEKTKMIHLPLFISLIDNPSLCRNNRLVTYKDWNSSYESEVEYHGWITTFLPQWYY